MFDRDAVPAAADGDDSESEADLGDAEEAVAEGPPVACADEATPAAAEHVAHGKSWRPASCLAREL